MEWYRRIVRGLFAVVFIAGGVSHLVLGRLRPEDYAAFGDTALFGWLGDLWASFVIPNIGWLTIVLAVYEIACGVGMIPRRTVTAAAWGMLAFLGFITVVGYGFPTDSWIEDVVTNRVATVVMAAMLVPLLRTRRERARPDIRGNSSRRV